MNETKEPNKFVQIRHHSTRKEYITLTKLIIITLHQYFLPQSAYLSLLIFYNIYERIDYFELLNIIIYENALILRLIFFTFTFCSFQFILWKYKNIRRKLFHVAIFIVIHNIYNEHKLLKHFMYLLELCLVCACFINKHLSGFTKILNYFRNENDVYDKLHSHIFFTYGILLLYHRSMQSEYSFLIMITPMCILDTFTSLSKDFKKKKEKTTNDFILGQIATNMVHLVLCGKTYFLYTLSCGLIEYFTPFNDNVALTMFALAMA